MRFRFLVVLKLYLIAPSATPIGATTPGEIIKKLVDIKQVLQSIDSDTGTNLYKQFELSGLGVNLEFHSKLEPSAVKDATSFLSGLGLFGGSAVAVGALAFTGITLFPLFLVSGLTGGVLGFLGRTTEDMKQELKLEAFNKGIEKFIEASAPILTKVVENIELIFDKKARDFHEAASASISILSNLLEQQESILQETLAQKEAESVLIQQKSLQLHVIETALNNLTKTALS